MIDEHDNNTIDFLGHRPPRRSAASDLTIDLTAAHRPKQESAPAPAPEPMAGELLPVAENTNRRHGGDLMTGDFSEQDYDLALSLGINPQDAAMDLVHDAALNMGRAATLLVRSGLALMAAKAKSAHGAFEQYCTDVGIPPQRAREAMTYARFAAQLPDSQRSRYLMLPKKSAFLLGNADPEVIELLLEDKTISKTSKLRTRTELSELARALTETEDELEKTKAQNEALEEEVLRLKEAQEAHVAGSEYPLYVVVLRKESSILADEAIACLSSIRSFADEFAWKHEGAPHSQQARDLDAGFVPAMAGVASILKAATVLLADMERQSGISAADLVGRMARYRQDELILIESARDTMLSRKEGKSLLRQSQYAANGETKRGRGRPKKVVNAG